MRSGPVESIQASKSEVNYIGTLFMPAEAGGDKMRAFSVIVFSAIAFGSALVASEGLDRARQLTNSGDSLGAKTVLAQAAQRNPKDITVLSEYAEFLDRYGDPAARAGHEELLAALGGSGGAG